MSNDLKNRFKNFEIEPSSKSWKLIKSRIARPINWWAIGSVIGGAIIITSIATFYLVSAQDGKDGIAKNMDNAIVQSLDIKDEVSTASLDKVDKIDIEENNAIKSVGVVNRESHSTQDSRTEVAESNINVNRVEIERIEKINGDDIQALANQKVDINEMAMDKPERIVPNDIDYESTKEDGIGKLSIDTLDVVNTRYSLFVPNVFTPDRETNNIFKPSHTELRSYQLCVYNRLGVLLFTSEDIGYGWNGKHNGRDMEMGVYVYVIKFENMEGYKGVQKGEINLIR